MNNFTPQRRGLGRGLGSLIPTGPLPSESDEREQAAAIDKPREVPADWIGRLAEGEGEGRGADHGGQPGEGRDEGDRASRNDDAIDGRAPDAAPDGSEDGRLKPVAGAYFAELPVTAISPNPRQPRQVFDEDAMAELVHSISEVGLLQPVVVRRSGKDSYELIMGERRWRATQQAGLDTIPAIVRATGDDDLLRDALLENLHRAELNPLEEAAAYQQLLDDFGCTHEELARRIGRSRPQISNTLRLLKLSPPVQRRVAAGVLSAGHARALLGIQNPEAQDRFATRVVAEGISVRGLEELVSVGDLGGSTQTRGRRQKSTAPALTDLGERLSDLYETRVKVDLGRAKGRITIEFASLPDLERIVAAMDPTYTRRHVEE